MDNMLNKLKSNPCGFMYKIEEKTDVFPIKLLSKANDITKTGMSFWYLNEGGTKEITIKSTANLIDGRKQICEVVYHFGYPRFNFKKNKQTKLIDIYSTIIEKDGTFTTKVYATLKDMKKNTPYKIFDGRQIFENNKLVRKTWTEKSYEIPGEITISRFEQTPVEKYGFLKSWTPYFYKNTTNIGINPYASKNKIFGLYSENYFGPMYRTEIWEETEDFEKNIERKHHIMYGSEKHPASYYHEIESSDGVVVYMNENIFGFEAYNQDGTNKVGFFAHDAYYDARHNVKIDIDEFNRKTFFNDYPSNPPKDETAYSKKIFDSRKTDPDNLQTYNVGIVPETEIFTKNSVKE